MNLEDMGSDNEESNESFDSVILTTQDAGNSDDDDNRGLSVN